MIKQNTKIILIIIIILIAILTYFWNSNKNKYKEGFVSQIYRPIFRNIRTTFSSIYNKIKQLIENFLKKYKII